MLKHKKYFFIILLFLILIILAFIFRAQLVTLFNNLNFLTPNNENTAMVTDNELEISSLESPKETVIGANYLEILSFSLDYSSTGAEVSFSIKNISSETHNSLNLLITFFDENSNVLATLNCPIKSINPNEKKYTYGIVDSDLSNYTKYEVKLLGE